MDVNKARCEKLHIACFYLSKMCRKNTSKDGNICKQAGGIFGGNRFLKTIMVLVAQLCKCTLKNECILCQLYLSKFSKAVPVIHVVFRMSQSTLSWLLCHERFPSAGSTGFDQRRAGGTLLEVEAVPCGALTSGFLL